MPTDIDEDLETGLNAGLGEESAEDLDAALDRELEEGVSQEDDLGLDDDTLEEPEEPTEPEEELIFKGDAPAIEDASRPEPALIKGFRQREREKDKELLRLKKELADAKKGAAPAQEDEDPGPRPSGIDYNFDEDKLADALFIWKEKVNKIEAAKKSRESEYAQKKTDYDAKRAKALTKVEDFEDAETAVTAVLTIVQQNALLQLAENSTALVYSLGKNPEELKRLAGINDPARFIAEMIRFETRRKGMPTTREEKPKPEARTPRSAGTATSTATAYERKLAQLEKKAEESGDRSEIIRFKRDYQARQNRK